MWRRRRDEFDEINVAGLRNVLAAARSAGTPRIVYTSSFLALPPAGHDLPGRWNDYQRTKVLADLEAGRAAADGLPIVTLYPGVIYGPGPSTSGNLVGRSVAEHLSGRLPGVIGAERTWSFSWIEDVAAAHASAIDRGQPGGRYCVGGENARQMAAFEIVRELTGRNLPRRIPAAAAVAAGLLEELRARLTGGDPRLTIGTVEILSRDWPLDSSRAVEEIGYRITPLREGMRRLVEGLQAQAPPGRIDGRELP
jgi:farnesol dehydrogenase